VKTLIDYYLAVEKGGEEGGIDHLRGRRKGGKKFIKHTGSRRNTDWREKRKIAVPASVFSGCAGTLERGEKEKKKFLYDALKFFSMKRGGEKRR